MEHPEVYSASEGARRAVLLVRGVLRVVRGKDTTKVDERLEKLAAEARAREAKTRTK